MLLPLIVVLAVTVIVCNNSPKTAKVDNMTQDCIFEIVGQNSKIIKAEIEGSQFKLYNQVFASNDYSGNGYCWADHIVQILEKVNPDLLGKINFDPEAGSFYMIANSISVKDEFLKVLCPIFMNTKELDNYLKSADRVRIDD